MAEALPKLTTDSNDTSVEEHRAFAALAAAYNTSTQEFAPVPPGARRVTFMVRQQKGAGANTRAQVAVEWMPNSTDGASRTFREPVVDPASFAAAAPEATFAVYQGAWLGPTITAAAPAEFRWHLTFEVPDGVQAVRMIALEAGTPANPGSLGIDVAFSGMM